MPEVVVDIQNITSAAGWYFTEYGGFEPVLCLALVSTVNTDYPTLTPTRRVLALDIHHSSDIVGMKVESKHTDIEFRSNADEPVA